MLQSSKQPQQLNNSGRLREITKTEFLDYMKREWYEGEHVVVMGPTGCGKTRTETELVGIRTYVVVCVIKRQDDSLELYDKQGYKFIKSWPPEHIYRHVVLWLKPKSIDDLASQSATMAHALSDIYRTGGWCVVFDEAGYVAGILGLRRFMAIFLNQGRSAYMSVVAGMTRPSSVVQQVPREVFSQARHIICFRYKDKKDTEAAADIAGISKGLMVYYMEKLRLSRRDAIGDFLYFGKGEEVYLVRTG